MSKRTLLVWLVSVSIAGCGSTSTSARSEEGVRERGEERVVPIEDAPPGPIDQAGTPCWADARATPYVIEERVPRPESALRPTVHSSARADASRQIHARPGETIRFDVAIENVGTTDIVLTEDAVRSLRELHVRGAGARWALPIDVEVRAGQRLAPRAVLRLCVTFDLGSTPIDAAPPSDEGQRAYALEWPRLRDPGLGGSRDLGEQMIVVRYPPDDERSVREPESWGGVIALRLAEGASIATIARETGVRIGSGVRLFAGRDEEPDRDRDVTYVQAPPDVRVQDAVARLAARSDVRSATPLMRGDPGTEGCSEYSPCPQGQQCCYLCGIPGCPHGCYAGPSCPTRIP